ncbi:DUF3083 family protein [Thalassotalea mangrovi]|uniref:DUF3083 family protein n=1 Tax=Thalassotalea mangrovi TaxID=2572245 RepID=A0A4U1B7H6_9GAMM|nr:DUF3083 family protein [Thalassotalea mangrovi]TKB46169.1 DUF3083 family protein [Thalassotalea mangrovi]
MLQRHTRMSLIRKRSAAHKVYLPASARENQYLLVEINPEHLFRRMRDNAESITPERVYQALSSAFFQCCANHQVENVSFIACNKLVRVMYSPEQQVVETEQQLIFLYNPNTHHGRQHYYDKQHWSKKIQLLFLATGDDIRHQAPAFHQQVTRLMSEFAKGQGISAGDMKIKDFQHLTYDVFEAHKGDKKTVTHGFRPIAKRYQQQGFILPAKSRAMTFAVASLPVTRNLLNQSEIDTQAADPFNPLYTLVADSFTNLARQYNLNHLAMVANGKIPIVRQSDEDFVIPEGELLNLGFNTSAFSGQLVSQWDASKLVDTIRLVFVASEHNCSHRGYGRFVNHLTEVLNKLTTQLGYNKEKDAITLRVFQLLEQD